MWEISKLYDISSQEIFSIFLIGYNKSHSVHRHQLLQLFYSDMMLSCKKKKLRRTFCTVFRFYFRNLFRPTLIQNVFQMNFCFF